MLGTGECFDSINRRRYDRSRSIESLQRGLLSGISLIGLVHKDLNGFVADRFTASVMDVGQRWLTCDNGSQAVSPGSTAETPTCSTALGTHRKCRKLTCS